MIGDGVAQVNAAVAALEAHPHQLAVGDQIFVSLGDRAAHELLDEGPAGGIAHIGGQPFGCRLADAVVLAIIGISERGGALRDSGRYVPRGVGDGAPRARRHVAVEVVGEGGIGNTVHGAGDRGHRMRPRLFGRRVAVSADIGFCGDVAQHIVTHRLHAGSHRAARRADGGIDQPVEVVIAEVLGETLGQIPPLRQFADVCCTAADRIIVTDVHRSNENFGRVRMTFFERRRLKKGRQMSIDFRVLTSHHF